MKSILAFLASATGIALLWGALLTAVGCSNVQSVGVSGGYSPATETATGAITIAFKTRTGQDGGVIVGRPTPRGLNTAGDYVSLGKLRQIAILAYKERRNIVDVGRAYGLNVFDIETLGIIKTLLTQANADPASL